MLRAVAYVLWGWVLLAAVPGLGQVFGLTAALPCTTAVILVHLAFSRKVELHPGLAIAVILGYLEDLHQGTPVGLLSLVHGVSYLLLRWSAQRFSVPGWLSRAAASGGAALTIDIFTGAILMVVANKLGLRREALWAALPFVGARAFTTFLVAQPVWFSTDWIFRIVRLDQARGDEDEAPRAKGHRPAPVGVAALLARLKRRRDP